MKLTTGKGLYAITSNADSLEDVKAVLQAGASCLQYREKTNPDPARARALSALCTEYDTVFIINDDPELAKDVNADGVHLGEEDASFTEARKWLGKDAIIGISCYDSMELARHAEKEGADYVAFGSFFPSETKRNPRRPKLELLRAARNKLSIPIVAIGGITPENAEPLLEAGADFIAAIHGLFGQPDPGDAAKRYIELFHQLPDHSPYCNHTIFEEQK